MPSLADLIREGEFAKGLDTPSGNPFGRWAQGVAQRTMHPLETLAGAAQESIDDPMATALNWANPMSSVSGNTLAAMAGIFAGKGAKTADVVKLGLAQKLKQAGIPDEQIWKETGWTSGFPDGKWRFEIPDNAAKAQFTHLQEHGTNRIADRAVEHQQLFDAYPDAKNISQLGLRETKPTGSMDATGNLLVARAPDTGELKSVGLHELQHAIQQREGFARGGSTEAMPQLMQQIEQAQAVHQQSLPFRQWSAKQNRLIDELDGDALDIALKQHAKDYPSSGLPYIDPTVTPMEAYRRLAGEAEARLTQARMNMTPEERLANYPVSMFDVPVQDQIVRYGDGQAMSVPEQGTDFPKLMQDAEDGMRSYEASRPVPQQYVIPQSIPAMLRKMVNK